MAYYLPDELPQRAIDLVTARNMLRALDWYRKAVRGAPMAELFEQLVAELESPREEKQLAALAAQFTALYERLEGGPPRFSPVTAAYVCRQPAESRHRCSSISISICGCTMWWLRKDEVKADERLIERAERKDVRALLSLSPEELAAARAKDLGPLWPDGKPTWLTCRWPTRREFRRRDRRVWGEDCPVLRPRGAPRRRLSKRLPELIVESLDFGPFELEYRVEHDLFVPENVRKGERGVTWTAKRDAPQKQTVILPGRHRFRAPARPEDLAGFRRQCGRSPLLAPLIAFYREHDGGFLYSPDGHPLAKSPIELVGLRQQEKTRRFVLRGVQHAQIDDPERVPRFLAEVGAPERLLHVLAFVGNAALVVPLGGRKIGKVYRVGVAARPTLFAPDFLGALGLFGRKAVSLAAGASLMQHIPEQPGAPIPLMRLRRVRCVDR